MFLTADIPGVGGVIKEIPEDFEVTEVQLYLPSGQGEHVYVEIEKRGITTLEAIRRLSRALGASERDIGYAGMKDSRGVTRQTLSIPRVVPEKVLALDMPGLKVLSAVRHGNKLRIGHLAGNRFRLTLRGVVEDAAKHAEHTISILAKRGVPNFFGPQRYGAQKNSHRIGRAILLRDHKGAVDEIIGSADMVTDERWQAAIKAYRLGDLDESIRLFPPGCRTERDILQCLKERPLAFDKALKALNPRLASLFLSAWQSALFDKLLMERLQEFDKIRPGDLAWKHANGACFLVDDPDIEAERATAFEISATGPLFGHSMISTGGEARILEDKVLNDDSIPPSGPEGGWPERLPGARRPLRVPLGEPLVESARDCLILEFTLPKGAYATAVLKEVMKTGDDGQ